MGKIIKDAALSVLFAVCVIVVVTMFICPALEAVLGIADFDVFLIILMIQGIQLAAVFFVIKQLHDMRKEKLDSGRK